MSNNENRYLYLYLVIVFGIWWFGIAIITNFRTELAPIIGSMSLSHPLVIFFTYLPSIAALTIYFLIDGLRGIKNILCKLIPRKEDLFLFPILFLLGLAFILFMRFGSLLFGMEVPTITYSPAKIMSIALLNFFKETALIGGSLGWVGFLLPFLQSKLKNSTISGLLTGLIFGLWVLPMPFLLGASVSISYILYLLQLMSFMVFISYIFNLTNGTVTFYLLMFWLVATGAHIQMYYFTTQIQIMQIAFFTSVSLITYIILKVKKPNLPLQTFPEFLQQKNSLSN